MFYSISSILGNNTKLFLQGQGDNDDVKSPTAIANTKKSFLSTSEFNDKSMRMIIFKRFYEVFIQLTSFNLEAFSTNHGHLSKSS